MSLLSRYFKQTLVLMHKTWIIIGVRHFSFTLFRAFILPIAYMAFISYAKNLFVPPSRYGFGDSFAVPSLAETVKPSEKLVFVHNNLGRTVDDLIEKIGDPVRKAGREILILENTDGLLIPCKQNLLGQSKCYGVVVFNSIPNGSDDDNSAWNYTLRGNAATSFSPTVKVDSRTNPVQSFLPLQVAVDNAILNSSVIPRERIYTSLSEEQRKERVRVRYNNAIIKVIAVAFFIGICPVTYQLVGLQAKERETGMSQLIMAMRGSQAARLSSLHFVFTLTYLPSWVLIAIILKIGVFAKTSAASILFLHILCGISLSSASLFVGSFFKKAQLSGIIGILLSLLLAILAQVTSKASTGTVAILGLLFPPMTYVYFIIAMAHFEQEDLGLSLTKAAPNNPSTLPAIALLAFFIVQSIVYPFLAAFIETSLYGTSSKAISHGDISKEGVAVETVGLTKRYVPNWFKRTFAKKETVTAANSLDLAFRRGGISVLLGANGSGKSTTLELIAGLNKVTDGSIRLASKSLSICPQKNVFWDDLTVEETVWVWSRLQCSGDTKADCSKLIEDCDLGAKRKAQAKTLSGGQKRKLQLAVAFAGHPDICLIDEITSGLDPISRRKIHDIILKERGRITMIMTSHYLSEAESIADHIVILSKGLLKCEGSVAELKTKLGGGYRVYCTGQTSPPDLPGYESEMQGDQTVYLADTATSAAQLAGQLTSAGYKDYRVHGPSIEDVFLKVSDEAALINDVNSQTLDEKGQPLQLSTGKPVSLLKQIWIMFGKRLLILRRNPLPSAAALIIPIAVAAITAHFLFDFARPTCSIRDSVEEAEFSGFDLNDIDFDVVLGPPSSFPLSEVGKFRQLLGSAIEDPSSGGNNSQINSSFITNAINFENSYSGFENNIRENYENVTGGVWYTGATRDVPEISFRANGGIGFINSIFFMNILTNLRSNNTSANGSLIFTGYKDLDYNFPPGSGDSLLFTTYFGLAMAVFPCFFVLYPTRERLRRVRDMQYSNGVRPLALWSAYTLFDFMVVLLVAVVSIAILAGSVSVWFEVGYLWLVLVLYGLAMTLGVYLISLVSKSQLSAFAISAGTSCVAFLLYFIAFMSVLTYSPLEKQKGDLLLAHFIFSALFPISSLLRAFFVSLNLFQILCKDESFINGRHMEAYGSPILFLILQILFCASVLLWWESGSLRPRIKRNLVKNEDEEDKLKAPGEKEVGEELQRVGSLKEGLRVVNLTKAFGKTVAVKDVTFGVSKGEVLGLLGPNGAGKSTTISMIQGDVAPSQGDVYLGDISVRHHRSSARQQLGSCPQHDFLEALTVLEVFRFYSRIRGLDKDVDRNIEAVVKAVGLTEYRTRLASELSGGNKRKLSLGIAIIGKPAVLLLDEPSSALDAAAKRIMWRTISGIGQSLRTSVILTSHDMEESNYLCSRILILKRNVLTIGTAEQLRDKYGAYHHVQLVLKSAPNTPDSEIENVIGWISKTFPKSIIEERSFHSGQIKFKVPQSLYGGESAALPEDESDSAISEVSREGKAGQTIDGDVISSLFAALESEKDNMGIAYYSVSQTTLEDVFLAICSQAQVVEEGYENQKSKEKKWWKWPKS